MCFSQKTNIYHPEQINEPKPYQDLLLLTGNNYYTHTNIKSIIEVRKYPNRTILDTISKKYFNENGLLIKQETFKNSK